MNDRAIFVLKIGLGVVSLIIFLALLFFGLVYSSMKAKEAAAPVGHGSAVTVTNYVVPDPPVTPDTNVQPYIVRDPQRYYLVSFAAIVGGKQAFGDAIISFNDPINRNDIERIRAGIMKNVPPPEYVTIMAVSEVAR